MKRIIFAGLFSIWVVNGSQMRSLEKECLKKLIEYPDRLPQEGTAREVLYNHSDDVRELWTEQQKDSAWIKKLTLTDNVYHKLSDYVERIGFISSQERIVVNGSRTVGAFGGIPMSFSLQFDFNGNVKTPILSFARDPNSEHLSEDTIALYELDRVWKAKRNAIYKKIIGIKAGAEGFVYDYAPGERFAEYISERAPLAQIMLLEKIRQAQEKGERADLSKYEIKILNGFPPQFEKAKEFLRKSVR